MKTVSYKKLHEGFFNSASSSHKIPMINIESVKKQITDKLLSGKKLTPDENDIVNNSMVGYVTAHDRFDLNDLLYKTYKTYNNEINWNWIDVSSINNFEDLFSYGFSQFAGDISKWNVSNAINMSRMFYDCQYFNCDLSSWDVSHVQDMSEMFYNCTSFNGDVSEWDVSSVWTMEEMFYHCENFNVDISKWETRRVRNMHSMFLGCNEFNQDLSGWNVNGVVDHDFMFNYCNIKEEFKPKFKEEFNQKFRWY